MVAMKDLLECGVHFGHQTRRWNPKMKKYIFGSRKNIHIIDLQKTLKYFRNTYNIVRDAAAEGQDILFVGTKKQAAKSVKEFAEKCDMPYVNYRWLGGMLTNFDTIKKSIKKLETIKQMDESGQLDLLTKKEALILRRKKEKLENYFGGIKDMKKLPDMIFVIDTVCESVAIQEASNLNIPVIAPIDTNCDPDFITYPIPGNDDAIRAIQLFCREMAEAMNEGKALRDEGSVEDSEEKSAEEIFAEAGEKEELEEKVEAKKEKVEKKEEKVEEKPAAKKAAPQKTATKTTTKKPAAKKVEDKEETPKKAATKKTTTKKTETAAKKSATKKTTTKTTAKKTATKKVEEKEAAPKKAVTKKAAAKKTTAKKTETATKKPAAKKTAKAEAK